MSSELVVVLSDAQLNALAERVAAHLSNGNGHTPDTPDTLLTADEAAKRLGVPFLGAIPLEEGIREDADSGTPVVISRPDSAGAQAFTHIASQVAARTSIQSFRQLPVINVR